MAAACFVAAMMLVACASDRAELVRPALFRLPPQLQSDAPLEGLFLIAKGVPDAESVGFLLVLSGTWLHLLKHDQTARGLE